MTATSTKDPQLRRLLEIDTEVEGVKVAFETAIAEVTGRPEIDGSAQKRLSEVAKRLAALKPRLEAADLSFEQKAILYAAMVDIGNAMNAASDELDRFEAALIGIERVRHVIRDALDEFVGGASADRRRLLQEIRQSLPSVRQADLAELLDVDPRTIRRWGSEPGEAEHRLRLVAHLIAILRHAWTPKGVIGWFQRPRRDLEGKRPIELLADPASERDLLNAARSSRNHYAT